MVGLGLKPEVITVGTTVGAADLAAAVLFAADGAFLAPDLVDLPAGNLVWIGAGSTALTAFRKSKLSTK